MEQVADQADPRARQRATQFKPGHSGNPLGRPSARARAERDAAEAAEEVTALVAELGRLPSHAESIIIDHIAHLTVLGRRLRRQGRLAETENVARLTGRLMRQVGLVDHDYHSRRDRRQPAPTVTATAMRFSPLAARAAARRAAAADALPAGQTPTSEPRSIENPPPSGETP